MAANLTNWTKGKIISVGLLLLQVAQMRKHQRRMRIQQGQKICDYKMKCFSFYVIVTGKEVFAKQLRMEKGTRRTHVK